MLETLKNLIRKRAPAPILPYATGFNLYADNMPLKTVQERLRLDGSKRILALDGGGIRGALSIGILEKLEEVLATIWCANGKRRREDFRLCHYFDFIIGTSTGSIIGTLLAAGLRVSDIRSIYKTFGKAVFSPRKYLSLVPEPLRKLTTRGIYPEGILENLLTKEFGRIPGWTNGNCTLAQAPLQTGLGIVIRGLDTDHTWIIHNNQDAKYYDRVANVELGKFIRASTAAPPFFRTERIKLGSSLKEFADGGVSAFNNPSLAAIILVALQQDSISDNYPNVPRGFKWKLGQDQLLLVSVGTGWFKESRSLRGFFQSVKPLILRLGDPMVQAFMGDSNFLTQAILLWMSKSETQDKVHGIAEDLSGEFLHPNSHLGHHFLTYLRYDATLHDPASYTPGIIPLVWAPEELERLTLETGRKLSEMDKGQNVDTLFKVGEIVGQRVLPTHFTSFAAPSFWP